MLYFTINFENIFTYFDLKILLLIKKQTKKRVSKNYTMSPSINKNKNYISRFECSRLKNIKSADGAHLLQRVYSMLFTCPANEAK